MRSILVDWLLQVHLRFHLLPETLFATLNILDRYLAVGNADKVWYLSLVFCLGGAVREGARCMVWEQGVIEFWNHLELKHNGSKRLVMRISWLWMQTQNNLVAVCFYCIFLKIVGNFKKAVVIWLVPYQSQLINQCWSTDVVAQISDKPATSGYNLHVDCIEIWGDLRSGAAGLRLHHRKRVHQARHYSYGNHGWSFASLIAIGLCIDVWFSRVCIPESVHTFHCFVK